MTSQYGAYKLHAGLARLHTRTHERAHTQKCVIFIAFPLQQLFANASQCYVIRTLSVFCNLIMILIFYFLKCH